MRALHIVTLIVAGFIIADLTAHPSGTSALSAGLQQVWQIMTNPLNTNGLGGKK